MFVRLSVCVRSSRCLMTSRWILRSIAHAIPFLFISFLHFVYCVAVVVVIFYSTLLPSPSPKEFFARKRKLRARCTWLLMRQKTTRKGISTIFLSLLPSVLSKTNGKIPVSLLSACHLYDFRYCVLECVCLCLRVSVCCVCCRTFVRQCVWFLSYDIHMCVHPFHLSSIEYSPKHEPGCVCVCVVDRTKEMYWIILK